MSVKSNSLQKDVLNISPSLKQDDNVGIMKPILIIVLQSINKLDQCMVTIPGDFKMAFGRKDRNSPQFKLNVSLHERISLSYS